MGLETNLVIFKAKLFYRMPSGPIIVPVEDSLTAKLSHPEKRI